MNIDEAVGRTGEFIQKNELINSGDKLVLALSGGADSVFLFHMLLRLNINFVAAHINHNLRGDESVRDENFVKSLCENNNIELFVLDIDVAEQAKEKKIGIEQCAREIRYEFFNKICTEQNCGKIATAHNANDVAETMIFNLMRGTGVRGIASIQMRRDNIIRPILYLEKPEIESCLNQNNIEYVTDSTNSQSDYTRNKIRHKIIPELEKLNPNLIQTMSNSAKLMSMQAQYIEKQTGTAYKQLNYKEERGINLKELFSFDEIIQKNMLIKILKGHNIKHDKILIDSLYDFLHEKNTGKSFSLSAKESLFICYGYAIISAKNKKNKIYIDDFNKKYEINGFFVSFEKDDSFKFENVNNFEKIFMVDCDKISNKVCIRSYKTDDKVAFAHRKGSKTLAKLFSDDKIPLPNRDSIPVFTTDDGRIFMLGRYGVTRDFAVDENTKKIMKIKIAAYNGGEKHAK